MDAAVSSDRRRRLDLPVKVAVNAFGGETVMRADVLYALSRDDIECEAERRGIFDDYDCDCEEGIGEYEFVNVRSALMRRDIPEALWQIEKMLRDQGIECAGFADDVERHYARAA